MMGMIAHLLSCSQMISAPSRRSEGLQLGREDLHELISKVFKCEANANERLAVFKLFLFTLA
jgi:hypothetical protein